MDALRELGDDVWFNLGDRDLAIGLRAGRRLPRRRDADRGARASSARRSACGARVLPMSDEPVRTRVPPAARWSDFQEFMIRERGEGPVEDVELRGRRARRAPTREALDAIAAARAIVIGPSNPVISIGPILAVPGMREALRGGAGAGRRRLARSSAARCSRARPRRSWPGPGSRRAPTASPPPTPACSTASSPTSAAERPARRSRPTRS